MKNYITKMCIIIFVMLFLNMVNSQNIYEAYQQSGSFNSTNNYVIAVINLEYSKIDKPFSQFSPFSFLPFLNLGTTKDYISGNNPDEIILNFGSSIKEWNILNPNNRVPICQLVINKRNINANTTDPLYGRVVEMNFTEDTDRNDFYMLQLHDGDYMSANFICLYDNLNNINLTGMSMPISMYTQTPTFNCKPCQFSEFVRHQSDVTTTSKFKSYNFELKNRISGFIDIAFELFLYSFWLFMIMMFFFVISMIFWVGYWVYFWIRSKAK